MLFTLQKYSAVWIALISPCLGPLFRAVTTRAQPSKNRNSKTPQTQGEINSTFCVIYYRLFANFDHCIAELDIPSPQKQPNAKLYPNAHGHLEIIFSNAHGHPEIIFQLKSRLPELRLYRNLTSQETFIYIIHR